MSLSFSYTFPCLRGTLATQDYYVVMCPLKLLPKIFTFDEAPLPPELRAQRTLNKARIPDIRDYMLNNRKSFAFSSITASVDSCVEFQPAGRDGLDSHVGFLVVPMSARFIINDGQHRRAAIEAALVEDLSLGEETISVVFFIDEGLRRSQQLFADLNKHAIRPTKSLGILYDRRDPLANLARDLAENCPPFKGVTDLEKTTLPNRSTKIFTLSGIYQASESLLGKKRNATLSDKEKTLCINFWTELSLVIPEWRLIEKKEISPLELRKGYIHAHSVALHALGIFGNSLIIKYPKMWEKKLKELISIDWSRSCTSVWEGRAMHGGQMSKARQNVTLTASFLKKQLGLPLTEEEETLEAGLK